MNSFEPLRRRGNKLIAVALAALLTAWMGCKPADKPTEPAKDSGDKAPAAQQTASGESAAPAAKTPDAPVAPKQLPPRKILESMVAKYKSATSYADKAELRVQASLGSQKVDQPINFLVALVRPNKIRMEVYYGTVVCDGKDFWAYSALLPDQVLKLKAPQQLTFQNLFIDEMLSNSITQGPTQSFSWVPPQLLLLWAEDPLKTILHQAQEPVLASNKDIDGHPCYGVEITRPEGKHVLWIDTDSFILRRLEYPTEELARELGGGQQLDSASLVANFRDAQLDAQVNDDAFQFEPDPAAEVVSFLEQPAMRMLGKPVPDFKFVDLDGKDVTPKSLEGKPVVLDFWATWCGPCRMSLPLIEKVYQQDKDKVQFLAVSIDDPSVPDDQLKKTFDGLKVNIPIARDPQQHVGKLFHIVSIPTTFVVGSKGIVQFAESGLKPTLTADLRERLTELLNGKDLYPQVLRRAEEQRKDYQAWLDKWVRQGLFTTPTNEMQEAPKAEIGKASQPKAFTLTSLWKNSELKDPGNILVVPRPDGSSQVFLLDGWKSVAEIGSDGKVVASHALDLDQREAASFLRTAVDGAGKRYFVASGMMQMRAHVFDENWKRLISYPADALDNPHAGILDVEMADLQGKGTPQLCLGYWGVLGVQSASLQGERLWANRSIDTVMRIAVLDPDAQGRRDILCTSTRGSLLRVDCDGKSQGEIQVPGTSLQWIVAADLDGGPPQELCGISAQEPGVGEVIGLDLKGQRLWEYPLPKGIHNCPVEQIVSGKLNLSDPASGSSRQPTDRSTSSPPMAAFSISSTTAPRCTDWPRPSGTGSRSSWLHRREPSKPSK